MATILPRFAIFFLVALPACTTAGAFDGGDDAARDASARDRAFAEGLSALDRADFDLATHQLATVAAICPTDRPGRRAMLLLASAELDPRNPDRRPDVAADLAAFQIARPDREEPWTTPLAREIYTVALDYGADPVAPDSLPGSVVIWSSYFDEALAEGNAAADAARVAAADSAAADPGPPAAADPADEAMGVPVSGLAATPEAPAAGGPLCTVPPARVLTALPELTRTPLVARVQREGEAPAPPAAPAGQVSGDVRALMEEVDRLRAELASKDQELDRIRRTLRP